MHLALEKRSDDGERKEPDAASPNTWLAGAFYLVTLFGGGAAVLLRGKLITPGNPASTAAAILAHGTLYRLSFTADLLATLAYVIVTLLLYDLFLAGGRRLSLLAVFFSLTGCAVGLVSCATAWFSHTILQDPVYSAFSTDQLQAFAFGTLRLRSAINNVGLVCFGVYCVLIGYLALHSKLWPRAVGGLMIFSGLSWLTFSYPPLAAAGSPYVLAAGFLGEAALTIWLLTANSGRKMRLEPPHK